MSSTEHELDILQLLLEGLTNREINRTELIIKYLIKRQHDHKCVFPKTNRIR